MTLQSQSRPEPRLTVLLCLLHTIVSLTLLYERSVHDPDGAVQGARAHAVGGLAWRCILGRGGAQRLQPVEQEDEDSHHGDGRGDAGPDGEVEGRKQREDVDLLFRLPQQDADAVVQVALAEVHHVLSLRCDGDGGHRQVGSLGEEGEEADRWRRTVSQSITSIYPLICVAPKSEYHTTEYI